MEKRRILGLLGAILLAIVGTVAIVAYVNDADARAQEGEDIVKVLVVKDQVPAGTPSEDLGDRVALESVAKKVEADGAVTKVKDVKGLVTSAVLVPGEQVVRARFVKPSDYRAAGASVAVPAGMLQTTISLDPERALGGNLTPGAKVAITASFDGFEQHNRETHTILQKVLVTNVQLSEQTSRNNNNDNNSSDNNGKQAKPGDAPNGQVLVTLALDNPSVEKLAYSMEQGHVWLSLEPDDANEGGTRVVDIGNIFQ